MSRLVMACSVCRGEEVRIDAWASWSITTQSWTLAETFPSAFCTDCDGETTIVERDLDRVEAPV